MIRRRQQAEKRRAHHLSDIVDSLVVQRRLSDDRACGAPRDKELDELAALAAELNAIELTPEPGFRVRLLHRLGDATAPRRRPFADARIAFMRALGAGLRPASALAVLAVIAVLLFNLRGLPAAASEILSKSDLAITKLVEPGKVLFRRWRIVENIWEYPGAPKQVVERYTLEWIDGSDIRHATGKSISSSGRMYLAYANVLDEGRYVPRVYYEPGYAEEADGLLSIVPSRQEFEAAAARFQGNERLVVDTYLARGSIYEPIVSERRFNDAMFLQVSGPEPLPQVVLSLDDSASLNGVPVYRVKSIEAVRVPFRWRSAGPPRMWIERRETVSYVSKESFLTLRSEETVESETGRHVHAVRELVAMDTLEMPSSQDHANPFNLENAVRVPARRQSASELLTQLTRTLRRAPDFLAQHRTSQTEEH